MADISQVKEQMEVVDAEDAHVGIVEKVEGDRVKLMERKNSGEHEDHYIEAAAIVAIAGNRLRLNTTGTGTAIQEKVDQPMNKRP